MSNTNEKSVRNRKIYEERRSGAQVTDLALKYGVSLPRIHRICLKEENKDLQEKVARLEDDLLLCRRQIKKD